MKVVNKKNRRSSLSKLFLKYYYKLIRANGTPHEIALGVAIGLFAGVSVPFGQIVLALVLAYFLKANKIFAFIFTFITNPYTSPVIYPSLCYLGSKILGINFTFEQIAASMKNALTSFSLSQLLVLGNSLLLSYLVGGVVVGLIVGFIGYFVSKKFLIAHRHKKSVRRKTRLSSLKNDKNF